jgi:hypothetical protein
MAKTFGPKPVTKPAVSATAKILLPPDVTSYFNDLETRLTPATESFDSLFDQGNTVHFGETVSPASDSNTTVVLKHNDAYHIYFHTYEVSTSPWFGGNLDAFTLWLMSLNADDVIYIYQSGGVYMMPIFIQALIAMESQCPAKKIFVLDHMIETPLFMLVCDEILVESTGAVTFSNCITDDARNMETICQAYLEHLYEKTIKWGMLTKEEVTSILKDNAVIFKLSSQLK